MEINKSNQVRSVAFQGYQHDKTETGAQAYHFNCMYDSSKYDCEFQAFKVSKDKKNNLFVSKGCNGSMEPFYTVDVPKEGVKIEPRYDLDLEDNEPFAYRFVLKDKSGNVVKYVNEDNNEVDGCSIITRRGTTVTKQGPMYLGMVDTFAPGYVFAGFQEDNTGEVIAPDADKKKEIADSLRSGNRTFANTMGGTMAGFVAKLHELREAGFKRLITTPLKGGDKSSHKYWNTNNYIMAGGIGNLNDYDTLQKEAFKNGMNLVDDGTFTSEGLQGIHFQRAIKWMDNEEKPAEYYYFRMSGIQDGALGLGVVPENFKNMNHKLVNSPFDYVAKKGKDGNIVYKAVENKQYDSSKPTVLQIFDDTMVSDEQRKDTTKVIDKYDKLGDGNKLGKNTHDDTTFPYSFEVDPYEYKKNVENLNEVNQYKHEKVKLHSAAGTMFVGYMSGLSIEQKNEGGFVCWDANTDMVKMNYFTSNYDNELIMAEKNPAKRAIEMDKYRRGNAEVQDMAVGAAKYWTNHVRLTHNEYVAKTLGEVSSNPAKAFNRISGILDTQNPDKPKLPEDVRLTKNIVENVLSDNYEMRPKLEDYHELLISSMMDLPLDSVEFAPDVQGALSSPFLSKRSPDKEHIGESRYDAMNDKTYKVPKEYEKTYNKMNDIFTGEMKDFADKVLQEVKKNSKEKLFEKGKMTEYGQYVIPIVAQDIARFAVTKGLMPDAKAKVVKGGAITYDYDDMQKNGTLGHMNINGDSQKDEANQIVNRLRKGIKDLSSEPKEINLVAESINKRIANTNVNSFKLAEVMVDRSGLGLDWRFDAAKDVADMDSVRNGDQRFDTAWNNTMNFWGNIVDAIKSENPNSYTVAELTDVQELIDATRPDDSSQMVYDSEGKAIGSLIDLAGITSEANYSYFFDGISDMFGYSYSTGSDNVGNNDNSRVNKLEDSLSRFAEKPIDYKRNSYTFASNHDKPRMIHCLSMDMSLFHADLDNKKDTAHRKTAYMIMNDIMNEQGLSQDDWNIINNDGNYFKNVSSKAVANGELLRNSIGFVNEKLKNQEKAEVSKSDISQHDKEIKYRAIEHKYDLAYQALSKSVADVVNGNYYMNESEKSHGKDVPDSLKKANEKDGFGSKPIPDAFDIVVKQAIEEHGMKGLFGEDTLNKYRNEVDSKATEVGRAKTRIIMRYLGALSGNPTLYGGDELGMTGYEDKCKNTYLQNRNALDWSVIDDETGNKRDDIVQYRSDILNISEARKDDDMNKYEAINNGTMYKLDKQDAKGIGAEKDKHYNCSAVISQAANGAMNISVFNPNGIDTNPKIPVDNIHPKSLYMDSIYLKGAKGKISLNPGTKFKNVNPADDSVYEVCKNGDDYFIKRVEGNKKDGFTLNETTAPDGVMTLYHIPDDISKERTDLMHKKVRAREYYNKRYNIPNNSAYDDTGKTESTNGKKIDVTSKE